MSVFGAAVRTRLVAFAMMGALAMMMLSATLGIGIRNAEASYCSSMMAAFNYHMGQADLAWRKGDYRKMQWETAVADVYLEEWYDSGCDR